MRDSVIAVEKVIQADPAVQNVLAFTGGGGGPGGGAINNGFSFIILKPLKERGISAAAVVDRLRPKLQKLTGASTFLQASQDLGVGGRQSNAAYQYQLSADTVEDLSTWGPRVYNEMRKIPQLKDVTTDQQNRGLQMLLDYDRQSAARFGITPQVIDNSLYFGFGEAQVSTIYTSLNQYYVVLQAAPQFLRTPRRRSASTYVHSNTGGVVPLNAFTHSTASHFSPRHQSLLVLSLGDRFLQSCPGVSLGQATLIDQMQRRIGVPASVRGTFAGTAEAFQKSLSTEPVLILTALLAIYIVLGMLYESLVHPITILTTLPSASVGAIIALIVFHSELDVISIIGIFCSSAS